MALANTNRRYSRPSFSNERTIGSNPWARPQYPRRNTPGCHRKLDMIFSLGRETNYEEVKNLLRVAGCIDPNDMYHNVRAIRIFNNNIHNGQVFVYCTTPGLSDIFAERLNALPGNLIRKCHSYTDRDIPVKFSFIHPSVNIQRDVVNAHLEKDYGHVKEWFELKETKDKIPTGAYTFIMREEDLKKNPLPEQVFLGGIPCYISYRTQNRVCYKCNLPGHLARDCKKDLFPQLSADLNNKSSEDGSIDVFLPGYIPPSPPLEVVTENNNKEVQENESNSSMPGLEESNKEVPTAPVKEVVEEQNDVSDDETILNNESDHDSNTGDSGDDGKKNEEHATPPTVEETPIIVDESHANLAARALSSHEIVPAVEVNSSTSGINDNKRKLNEAATPRKQLKNDNTFPPTILQSTQGMSVITDNLVLNDIRLSPQMNIGAHETIPSSTMGVVHHGVDIDISSDSDAGSIPSDSDADSVNSEFSMDTV